MAEVPKCPQAGAYAHPVAIWQSTIHGPLFLNMLHRQPLAQSKSLSAELSGPQIDAKVCQCPGVPKTAVPVLDIAATFEQQQQTCSSWRNSASALAQQSGNF